MNNAVLRDVFGWVWRGVEGHREWLLHTTGDNKAYVMPVTPIDDMGNGIATAKAYYFVVGSGRQRRLRIGVKLNGGTVFY